jgi:RHS repeat-associated protein
MSGTNTTDSQGLGAQAQTPAERVFQIDPSGLGGIAQSVNLFRGDVSVPLSVVSLTSRSGIDASLALIYNSNTGEQVDTWNLAAPTGPVGMGWSLGYEFIARDATLAAKPIDGICYLVAGGSSNRLFRTAVTPTYWEYEAQNYLFWRIRYYPESEQWELVQEDGTRRLYGGLADGAGDDDGAVQYGIKWVGAEGNWSDATVVSSGQSRYAVGWNLAVIVPPWGDGVRMEYENTRAVIGDNAGLAYTVSSRLKRVVVPMVRNLVFNYLPKLNDATAREYQVPHLDPNTPTLHAYQDRYETHFLASVEVRNAEDAASAPGSLIQRVDFEYALVNMSLDHQGDPDYVKRYLTAVSYTTPQGLAMPDVRFDYYNDPAQQLDADFNRGALKSILYPQGGRITYTYRHTMLAGTDRSLPVSSRGTPRVWFGADYAVLVNYEGVSSGLSVRIFSWNGQWVEAPATYNLSQDIDLATLQVSLQPEFFALACRTAGASPDLLVLLFHKQKGRYGQWITEQGFTSLPLQNGDQAQLATGTDFAVALSSGPNLMAKVWDERTSRWIDEAGAFAVPSNASYALAASADYVALASADAAARRVRLQIWYRVRQGTGFSAAQIDQSTLSDVDWQSDSTPLNFWSLGSCFASMTYVNGGDDHTIRYTVKVLQWNDSFYVRTVLDQSLTIDADTKLPYAQSVVSGSVLGNVEHLFRYDGQTWQLGTLPAPNTGGESPRFVYGSDVAVVSGKDDAAIALFNPYQPNWEAAVRIPISQLGITPTANGDYVSVDRQVYYRDPANALQPVYVLDSNMVAQSLVNRAPYFIAYEDQSGNTHVLPLCNGAVDAAAEVVLANERIHVPDGGQGTSLVGPSALMTYQGSFDSPSALKLYQFVQRDIHGQIDCYPVEALRIDDGYPDKWDGVWTAASKCSRFYYDCDNVTVTPDGTVTEFAAATIVYGAGADNAGVAYPPPVDTLFGRSEYRFHNNRSPRTSGLVPDDAMLDASAVTYYSFLNGMLFDQTDYDAAGMPVERTYNIYDVRTEIASIDDASTRLPIVGGYVKRPRTEISQYEQVIEVPAQAGLALTRDNAPQPVPPALAKALGERSVALHPAATLVAARDGGHWRLYADPASPRYLPVSVRGGGLVASVAVTRQVGSDYSWQTGLLSGDFIDNYNSHGKHETLSREVYYAWQVPAYAQLKAAHIWAPVAVSIRFWREDGMAEPGLPQTVSLNTLAPWFAGPDGAGERWAPRRNFVAASASVYDPTLPIPVRFDAWDNLSLPSADLWRLSGDITLRDSGGTTLEARDAFGRPTATLLNRCGTARVAEFSNATTAETLYSGFERYEDLARWRLDSQPLPGDLLVSGDAHTGSRALRVAGDASQVVSTALSLEGGKTYILACWVKTPTGFDGVAGHAQWQLVVGGQTTRSLDIAGSDGAWAYRHWPVTLPGNAPANVVSLQLSNAKSGAQGVLLLDDVMFAPLVGSAGASVYDEVYGAAMATLALNGNTTRSVFDSRQRVAAQAGASGQVQGGSLVYLVRENDPRADFQFAPADPNAVTDVASAGGGAFADFMQGSDWTSQWDIVNTGAWQVTDGVLTHVGSGTDSIAFRPSNDLTDYGVLVTVRLPQDTAGAPIPPAGTTGLDIGADLSVRWEPVTGWRLTLAGTTHELGMPRFANDWALFAPVDPVSGTNSVHFYAGGRLLFAQTGGPLVRGAASLVVTSEGVGFSALALLRAPALSAVFLDGSGKERQQQSFSGEGTVVSGSLYDPIGRAAIGVKPANAPGRGLAYDEDYVRSFDPTSGVMTGRAASAYPDDEGYPYVRTEYFRTAQSLASRQGAPGKALAIAYTGGAGAPVDANPHTQQFSYGTNVQGQFGGDNWPSNRYFVKKITDPNGDPSFSLTSQTDQTLASLSLMDDGGLAVTQYFYDGSGRIVKTLPPAGVDALRAGDPDADRWASTTTYSFLGEGIESHEPDAGLTRSVFGADSQLRFVAGPDESDGLATIRYVKYDLIGRDVEAGIVRSEWNRQMLQRVALEDPSWPGAAQGAIVNRSYAYDGDGSDPTQFGRLVRCIEQAPDGLTHVEQRYAYDATGLVREETQTATAFDATARTTRYAYDALGRVVGLTYPQDSEIPQIAYAYTRLGQIFEVGTPQAPDAFARFSYSAAGQVESSVVRLAAAMDLLSQARYGPPGWLQGTTTTTSAGATVWDEGLSYTEGGYQDTGYFDGKIASVEIASDAGGAQRFAYAYDTQSRLRMSQRSEGGQSSTDAALTYDANGNIATLETGGVSRTYTYQPHTDRVDTVQAGGTTLDAFRYNEQGAAIAAQRLGLSDIAYSPSTGLTDTITLGNGHKVIFGYDANQARSVKRLTDASGGELSAKQYLRDRSGSPLLELSRTVGGEDAKMQYLYGPSGLIGMQLGGQRYAVVRDHLGSVRCVVDATGAVVAQYDYTAFGVTVTRAGSTRPDILYYRYTGQELDAETGLYNYQARFYDPELGRFVAVDPQRQGSSPYVYVLNNPIGLVDPDGEEALTAFLIAVIVSAIIGAVVGAVTYAVTHQGNFDVAKFFLYATAGLVAGAVGGAAAFGGGLMATAALGAIGVSTSTSIGSGIVVGAVAGAADGVVAGTMNQVGVNLIEGRPLNEGVGQAAWMGAAIGGAAGAVLGGITGAINYRTASRLASPTRVVSSRPGGANNAFFHGAALYDEASIGNAAAGIGRRDVVALNAHGGTRNTLLKFDDAAVTGPGRGMQIQDISDVVADLGGTNFTGGGLDLSGVCYAGTSGVARTAARDLGQPVRAATGSTWTAGTDFPRRGFRVVPVGQNFLRVSQSLQGITFRTYYPSQLRTGWNYLFGY